MNLESVAVGDVLMRTERDPRKAAQEVEVLKVGRTLLYVPRVPGFSSVSDTVAFYRATGASREESRGQELLTREAWRERCAWNAVEHELWEAGVHLDLSRAAVRALPLETLRGFLAALEEAAGGEAPGGARGTV